MICSRKINSHPDHFQADIPSAVGSRAKSSVPTLASAAQMLRRAVRAAIPEAIRARIRPNRKPEISQEQWEQEYREGCWRHLQEARELAHYSVTNLLLHVSPTWRKSARRRLWRRRPAATVAPAGLFALPRIDKSQEAIARAQTEQDALTDFVAPTQRVTVRQDRFDVIVFNELLYYLHDPADVVPRLGTLS
jgi:hypothetical protein